LETSIIVFNSIFDIDQQKWNAFIPKSRFFLSYNYLSTLEKSNQEMEFRYLVLVDKNNCYVGMCYFQIVAFKGEMLYKYVSNARKLLKLFLEKSLSLIDSKIIALGNLIFTCESGVYFSGEIKDIEKNQYIQKMIQKVEEPYSCKTIGLLISEELTAENYPFYKKSGFEIFEVENKMIFKSLPFANFEEYQNALTSKYRIRKNKIYKLNEHTEVISIDKFNFDVYENEIQKLFSNVLERSKFKLMNLNSNYFKTFLDQESDVFKMEGYLIQNQLVGFISYFEFEHDIEVHYLGLDYQKNDLYKLYNFILYKMIEKGYEHQREMVCLSRTAQEIKSTLGAKPVKVYNYIKVNNSVVNKIVPLFLEKLKPEIWQERNPFKS
jgi:hypothetical protein